MNEKEILDQMIKQILIGIKVTIDMTDLKGITEHQTERALSSASSLIFALSPAFEYIKKTMPENSDVVDNYKKLLKTLEEGAKIFFEKRSKEEGLH